MRALVRGGGDGDRDSQRGRDSSRHGEAIARRAATTPQHTLVDLRVMQRHKLVSMVNRAP